MNSRFPKSKKEDDTVLTSLEEVMKTVTYLTTEVAKLRREVDALKKSEEEDRPHVGGYATVNARVPDYVKGKVISVEEIMRKHGANE